MPWLTPDDDPSFTTWVVFLPDGVDWIACFIGAFMSLCEPDNWQEFGTITPEEAAAKWQEALRKTENENANP